MKEDCKWRKTIWGLSNAEESELLNKQMPRTGSCSEREVLSILWHYFSIRLLIKEVANYFGQDRRCL
jgi:hypothetical protein